MLEIKDIEKLAKLARIELTQREKENLLKEVDPILGYVSQLKEVVSSMKEDSAKKHEHRNITREDSNPTDSGTNTETIIAEMPESKENYLKVKNIL